MLSCWPLYCGVSVKYKMNLNNEHDCPAQLLGIVVSVCMAQNHNPVLIMILIIQLNGIYSAQLLGIVVSVCMAQNHNLVSIMILMTYSNKNYSGQLLGIVV